MTGKVVNLNDHRPREQLLSLALYRRHDGLIEVEFENVSNAALQLGATTAERVAAISDLMPEVQAALQDEAEALILGGGA